MCDVWVNKIWGRTKEISSSKSYSCHELEVNAGSYCSMHYHRFRSNKFLVHTGQIQVIEFYGPHVKITSLLPNETLTVPALVVHLFAVVASGALREEYFSEGGDVDANDIIRIIEGGLYENIDKLPNQLLISALR